MPRCRALASVEHRFGSGAPGTHVLVNTWPIRDARRDPYVVVVMANSDSGGISGVNIQSVAGRILQLTAALP
jgi:hypothetical protein